jgi:crotonobetainyl-CoA:carnitine CoA-transferase CaiB-like acyl-CoA transferase
VSIAHSRPLEGVRVLDLTRFVAGPYCTMLLADAGADVVKVEPPGGEQTRSLPPMTQTDDAQPISTYFLRFNRGKRSVVADLRTTEGLEVLRRLIGVADVLVENFRPGVLEAMGLGWPQLQELNKGLIYCTLTGYGYENSPLRERGAFTPIIESSAGAVIHQENNEPPLVAGYPVGDIFPASLAVASIAMALFRRTTTGEGARVDVAMYDAMLSMNERAIAVSAMLGTEVLPGRKSDVGAAPSDTFRTADGFVSIAVVGEPIWRRFCEVIGQPNWADDVTLSSGQLRAEQYRALLKPVIDQWLAQRNNDDVVSELNRAGVPAAPVLRPLEVARSEQAQVRGMIWTLRNAGDSTKVVGNPIRFAGEHWPRSTEWAKAGEHTDEVLSGWLETNA